MMKSLFAMKTRREDTDTALASEATGGGDDDDGSATAQNSADRPAKKKRGSEGDVPEPDAKKSSEHESTQEQGNAPNVARPREVVDDYYETAEGDDSDEKVDDDDYVDVEEDSEVDDELNHNQYDGEDGGDKDEGYESPSDSPSSGAHGPSNTASFSRHLIGRRAKIISGPEAGSVGTVIAVGSRGWWTLDNQERAVRSRQCILVDEAEEEVEVNDVDRATGIHSMEQNPNGSTSTVLGIEDAGEIQAPLRMSDLLDNAAEPPSEKIYCNHGELLEAKPKPWALPPVVLEGPGIPSALEHLDPDAQLQIFDRKLGIILYDRVSVQALPALLREHAEYEPIVPPREQIDTPYVRQGRSDPNLLICAEVRPQTKSLEGKKVVITSGLYQGRRGRIQTSIPGGWYLVEGILTDVPLVVSPDCVEEIQKATTTSNTVANGKRLQRSGNFDTNAAGASEAHMQDLCSTLNEAIEATIQDESDVLRTQVDVLRKDKRNLEQEMEEIVGDETVKRRMAKRLDYVTSCLNKAEENYAAQELSARTTKAVAEGVINGAPAGQGANGVARRDVLDET